MKLFGFLLMIFERQGPEKGTFLFFAEFKENRSIEIKSLGPNLWISHDWEYRCSTVGHRKQKKKHCTYVFEMFSWGCNLCKTIEKQLVISYPSYRPSASHFARGSVVEAAVRRRGRQTVEVND